MQNPGSDAGVFVCLVIANAMQACTVNASQTQNLAHTKHKSPVETPGFFYRHCGISFFYMRRANLASVGTAYAQSV
jgi:hypothetical protein